MLFNFFKNTIDKQLEQLNNNIFKLELNNNKLNSSNLKLMQKILDNNIENIKKIHQFLDLTEEEFVIKLLKNKWFDENKIKEYLIKNEKINHYLINYPDIFFNYIKLEIKNLVFLKFFIDNEIYLNLKDKRKIYYIFTVVKNNENDISYILTEKNKILFFKFLIITYILNIEYKKEIENYLLFLYKNIKLKINKEEYLTLLKEENYFYFNNPNMVLLYLTKTNKNIISSNVYPCLFICFNLYFLNSLNDKIVDKTIITLETKNYYNLEKHHDICLKLENWKIELFFITELFFNKEITSNILLELFLKLLKNYNTHQLNLFSDKLIKILNNKYNNILTNKQKQEILQKIEG